MSTQDSKNNKKQLGIIFLTVFIYLLGFGIIIPILPILSRDFGATPTETGMLMSIYSLMQFIFSPFWGRLSDRYGRRPILLFCMVSEGLSYVLFAMARDIPSLFLARGLAGFFGASISTASAYISDITPTNERSKGMALIGAAFGLGFVLGPAIGAGLAIWGEHISKEKFFGTSFATFWVAGICFVNFLFGIKFLKESLKEKNKATKHPHRIKLIYQYFSKKTVGPLMLTYFLSTLSMAMMEATLVLYMGKKYNWGIKEVSFGFAYVGIVMVFTQGYLVRKLLPAWGERNVLRTGLALLALGMIGIGISHEYVLLGFSMTLLSLGNGFINPSILGSISLLSAMTEQGVTMGITQSMASLGRILGPTIGGWIYGNFAIESPFFSSGIAAFFGIAIVQSIFQQIPMKTKHDKDTTTSASAETKTADLLLHQIGKFQLDNLIKNQIPFYLINLGLDLNKYYSANEMKQIEKNTIKAADNNYIQYFISNKIPKDQAIIIICKDGLQSKKLISDLKKEGYENSYYLPTGEDDLTKG